MIGTQTTIGQGQANFQGLPLGRYNIEVLAPGFDTVTEQAEILTNGDQEFITIVLKPRPGTDLSLVRSGPPVLAPGPQKELAKAMELLRTRQSRRSEKASRQSGPQRAGKSRCELHAGHVLHPAKGLRARGRVLEKSDSDLSAARVLVVGAWLA